jgi:hypothetical protein
VVERGVTLKQLVRYVDEMRLMELGVRVNDFSRADFFAASNNTSSTL